MMLELNKTYTVANDLSLRYTVLAIGKEKIFINFYSPINRQNEETTISKEWAEIFFIDAPPEPKTKTIYLGLYPNLGVRLAFKLSDLDNGEAPSLKIIGTAKVTLTEGKFENE